MRHGRILLELCLLPRYTRGRVSFSTVIVQPDLNT